VAVVVCTKLPTVAVIVTVDVPEGVGGLMVTAAESLSVTSACEIAETITELLGVGTTAGAVYSPVLSTLPTVGLPRWSHSPARPLACWTYH